MGPVDQPGGIGKRGNAPEDYLQVFRHFGVTHVIRLNEAKYDRIVKKFLEVSEAERGALAIHCKAGLGRTGTLIGIYAMKHFQFPAAYFIGWIRIARPGSILGP